METASRSSSRRRVAIASALALVALVAWNVVGRTGAAERLRARAAEMSTPIVSVTRPESGPVQTTLVLPGQALGLRETGVHARASGYVREWNVDIGDRVSRGQVLAVVASPELDAQLQQAEADLAGARATAAAAGSAARRATALAESAAVSRQEAEDRSAAGRSGAAAVAAAEANVRRLRLLRSYENVVAPYDGVVTARTVEIGTVVGAPGAQDPELFRISDDSRVRIQVAVPQADAGRIPIGMPARVGVAGAPGDAVDAVVVRTSSAIDAQSRTLRVELRLSEGSRAVLPGSFVEVTFMIPGGANSLQLPANAVAFDGNGVRVATVGRGNRATWKDVQLGRDLGTSLEVLGGLAPGDLVVVNPPATLRSGDVVEIARSSRTGAVR